MYIYDQFLALILLLAFAALTVSAESQEATLQPTYTKTEGPVGGGGGKGDGGGEERCLDDVDYRFKDIETKSCAWASQRFLTQRQTKIFCRRKVNGVEVWRHCKATCSEARVHKACRDDDGGKEDGKGAPGKGDGKGDSAQAPIKDDGKATDSDLDREVDLMENKDKSVPAENDGEDSSEAVDMSDMNNNLTD